MKEGISEIDLYRSIDKAGPEQGHVDCPNGVQGRNDAPIVGDEYVVHAVDLEDTLSEIEKPVPDVKGNLQRTIVKFTKSTRPYENQHLSCGCCAMWNPLTKLFTPGRASDLSV